MSEGTGHGTTITFATSGFTAHLRNLSGLGFKRGKIDTTHMETEDAKTNIAEDLYEMNDITAEIFFDPAVVIPSSGTDETITIDFKGSGKTFAGTGRIAEASISVPMNDMMTCSLVLHMTSTFTRVTT